MATNLVLNVSEEEKKEATKAILYFDHLLKIMKICNDHLDLMYIPFKNNSNASPEEIFSARAALRRYRDKMADNFNILKRQAFKSFIIVQKNFSSDTQIAKIIKSFVLSISDIEKQVNRLIDLFSNLESKEFVPGIISGIENVKKEMAELHQIIEDRIKEHIQNNILARNWVNNLSDELEEKIEERKPIVIQLMEEEEKK